MMIGRVLKLLIFRMKWRKNNKHNRTSVKRVFDINKVDVGKGTYGSLTVYDYSDPKEHLHIGNYVSIAGAVKILLGGNHHFDRISTYPFETFLGEEKDNSFSKGTIEIGDDVWIGTGVIILSGVKIGQGAVIGAGSVVSKDIPPYAIAAGNPCKVIKYRFNMQLRDQMMKIDYDKIDEDFIKKNYKMLIQIGDDEKVNNLIGMLEDD